MPESPEFDGRLLITGATGFVGGAVVRALLARGVAESAIRCVVRDPARAAAAGLPAACLHRADLANDGGEPALAAAARGATVVLHCAGSLKAWGSTGYRAVNVDGTARLLAAVAAAAPAAHLVLVSSLAAAGPSVDGAGSAAMPESCQPVSAYGASKRDAELLVVQRGPRFTIVRPSIVYGPRDAATQLLFRQGRGPIAFVPALAKPLSIVHVDDTVEVLLRAMQVRPAGAVIPIDGPERTDTHSLIRAIATACGRRVRLVPVPIAVASGAALLCDTYARATRSSSFFNRDKVREIRACGWVADGTTARGVLGFVPRIGLAAGLAAVAVAEGFARPAATSATA